MFTEDMIAPCGLDCSLCTAAHQKENPCKGCTGPDEYKREFCSTRCAIIQCMKKGQRYRFCDECSQFPCEFIHERENRYQSQYVLKESPLTNLKNIRAHGMDWFLKQERQKWTCPVCGGVLSVHDGVCSKCGKKYDQATHDSLPR